MKKGREKGGKEEKEKVIKHTLKYLYEAYMTAKNPQKRKNFKGGGGKSFSGWPEYIPLPHLYFGRTLLFTGKEVVTQ